MALTSHPITTTTNASPQASESAQLHLPPPQTFDILPPLHELLARIDVYHSQNHPGTDLDDHAGPDDAAADLGASYAELQPLNPKDLPTAVLDIKARVRHALKELEKLPDMDRTTEEQTAEIAKLETRIAKQQELLHSVASLAKSLLET